MDIKTAQFIKTVCDNIGNQECDIRSAYLGRGMSKPTIGVVVDSQTLLIADLIQYFRENINHNREYDGAEIPDISDFRIDNMARSVILY